jgi:NTE family protein
MSAYAISQNMAHTLRTLMSGSHPRGDAPTAPIRRLIGGARLSNILHRDRALVLGGGGSSGNAWLIGVAAGLLDVGLDVTEADLIVGTSAGSTTAAQIASTSVADLYAATVAATPPQRPQLEAQRDGRPKDSVSDHMERTAKILAEAADPEESRRELGASALALSASSNTIVQAQWRATVASRLPSETWPERAMLVTAVEARTGDPVVFDRDCGVDLADAVAASCAGGFAFSIGDTPYIDGGYRTDANADLAAGYKRVLIIPPFGDRTRKPLDWGLHLEVQVANLRACGTRVECIYPGAEAVGAFGDNMMDLSRRRPSAEAGYRQCKSIARQLTKFWR